MVERWDTSKKLIALKAYRKTGGFPSSEEVFRAKATVMTYRDFSIPQKSQMSSYASFSFGAISSSARIIFTISSE